MPRQLSSQSPLSLHASHFPAQVGGSGSAPAACDLDEAPRVAFTRLFFAFFLPALVTKFAMILVDLREMADAEWTIQLVGRGALFMWGRDLWLALALSMVCFGFMRMALLLPARTRVGARALVDLTILAHAVFCALAFAYFVEEGDFVTCQLAALVETQGEQTGLWSSMWSALNFSALFMLALCMSLAGIGCRCVGVRIWSCTPKLRRGLAVVLVIQALLAAFVVPALVRGDLPVRFKSHGLERNAVIRLASSCAEARFDNALEHAHAHVRNETYLPPALSEAEPASPAALAQVGKPQATHVVLLVLESVMDPMAFDEAHAMPYTRELLAREGSLHLDTHYATYALTTKSVFSILMGEYPDPNYAAVVGRKPSLAFESLPSRLQDAGYATWFVSSQDLAFDRQRSFYARHGFDRIEDKHELGGPGIWETGWGVDDAQMLRRGFELVDAHTAAGEQPFFLTLQTFAAHHPYEIAPSESFPELAQGSTRKQKYERALRHLDGVVEGLFEGLEARGLSDNTLVVVVSDHGEGWGEYRGRNVAEPNIRPLAFMRGPQLTGVQGQRVGTSSHVDLAPTVLGLVGQARPCTMVGRDLSVEPASQVQFFAGRPPKSQRGLRDGRWKFVQEQQRSALYDLERDPDARQDLSAAHPERAARYRHMLEDWSAHAAWRFEHAPQVRGACAREPRG